MENTIDSNPYQAPTVSSSGESPVSEDTARTAKTPRRVDTCGPRGRLGTGLLPPEVWVHRGAGAAVQRHGTNCHAHACVYSASLLGGILSHFESAFRSSNRSCNFDAANCHHLLAGLDLHYVGWLGPLGLPVVCVGYRVWLRQLSLLRLAVTQNTHEVETRDFTRQSLITPM